MSDATFDSENFTWHEHLVYVVRSVGYAMGFSLLWALETLRNGAFGLMDRLNLKPRRRTRSTAYPPGPVQS
jgi:hypothetical protein